MGMIELGSGMYLFDSVRAGQMPCLPRDVNVANKPGVLGNEQKREVTARIIGIAQSQNAWLGVRFSRLIEGIRAHDKHCNGLLIKQTIKEMVKDGLLEIPGCKGRLSRWFQLFFDPNICPSPELIGRLLAHQTA